MEKDQEVRDRLSDVPYREQLFTKYTSCKLIQMVQQRLTKDSRETHHCLYLVAGLAINQNSTLHNNFAGYDILCSIIRQMSTCHGETRTRSCWIMQSVAAICRYGCTACFDKRTPTIAGISIFTTSRMLVKRIKASIATCVRTL